jgi:hypothetical protein
VEDGRYDLLVKANHFSDKNDGVCLLPQVWGHLIRPFWAVSMHMYPTDLEYEAQNISVSKRSSTPSLPLAKTAQPKGLCLPPKEKSSTSDSSGTKSSVLASQQPERKDSNTTPASSSVLWAGSTPIVKLTDCIGRKLAFPLEMVRTREVS